MKIVNTLIGSSIWKALDKNPSFESLISELLEEYEVDKETCEKDCTYFIELGSEQAVKDAGKFHVEGKNYIVDDGDILHIRFNV